MLAHGFASWVSTRISGDGSEEVDSWDLLQVQLGGALAVASLAMLAVVDRADVDRACRRPASPSPAVIAAQVFLESRTSQSTVRAALFGLLALVAGVTVATLKSLLVH